jgi:hypothetical protein
MAMKKCTSFASTVLQRTVALFERRHRFQDFGRDSGIMN